MKDELDKSEIEYIKEQVATRGLDALKARLAEVRASLEPLYAEANRALRALDAECAALGTTQYRLFSNGFDWSLDALRYGAVESARVAHCDATRAWQSALNERDQLVWIIDGAFEIGLD